MLYTCQISLNEIEPKIWRRFRFHSEITFRQLHQIVQCVMGWENYHLFEFEVDGNTILLPDPTFPPLNRVELNARREIVSSHFSYVEQSMLYTYDLGDNWGHTITLEKVEPVELDNIQPVCLDGKCSCPQEDSGGIWGHQRVLEVMSFPDHPDREELMDWLRDGYDPEAFDLKLVNDNLREKGEKLIPKALRTPIEAKKPVKLTKAALKKQLKTKTRDELADLIVRCSEVSKDVERHLAVALLGEPAVESIYLEYRSKVQDAFHPKRGGGMFHFQFAKKDIAEFKRITGSAKYTTDLMLVFVESGVEFTNTFGDIDATFYNMLAKMYEEIIIAVNLDETADLWEELEERISAVVENTDGIGWGFHNNIEQSYSQVRWM